MRKISTCLILVLIATLFLGAFPTAMAAGNDPYVGFKATTFDYTSSDKATTQYGYVGNLRDKAHAIYKGVNFGKYPPVSVNMTIGVGADYVGSTYELRVDSLSGPVLATIEAGASGGWEVPGDNIKMITTEVTGVHDLYLVNVSGTANLYEISFVQNVVNETGYAEYKDSSLFPDVDDASLRQRANVLNDLGLIPDYIVPENSLQPAAKVSRAELSEMLYKILGDKYLNVTPKEIFEDVLTSHPYAPAITCLYDKGYINGYNALEFRPDEDITVTNAVVILTKVLGYMAMAEVKGGYPSGYLAVANEEGLLDGISTEGMLTRGNMINLIFNAINADFMDVSVFAPESVNYKRIEGILSQTYGYYYGTGIIEATGLTGLYNPVSSCKGSEVIIDGNKVNVGDTAAAGLLGYKTEYYYKVVDGEKVLISIYPSEKTEEIVLNSNDETIKIQSITSNGISYYDKNDYLQKIGFNTNVAVLYNGKAVTDSVENMLDPGVFRGTVKCVDNGEGYSFVSIEQYRNVIIGNIDAKRGTIVDELTNQVITIDSEANSVYTTKEGIYVLISRLAKGDVLAIYESKNPGRKFIKIISEPNTVSGTISEIVDGKVKIGNKLYAVASECNKLIQLGLSGDFVVGIHGEILSYTLSSTSDMVIGCLLDYPTTGDGSLTSKIDLKILKADGKIEIFKCASPLRLDGESYKTPSEVVTKLASASIGVNTPVRYKVNASGEITVIDTVATDKGGSYDKLVQVGNKDAAYYYGKSGAVIGDNSAASYILPSTGVVINLATFGGDETLYSISTVAQILTSTEHKYIGTLYTTDSNTDMTEIFVYTQNPDTYAERTQTKPMVFEKIRKIVNANDEVVYRISCFNGSNSYNYEIDLDSLDPTSALYKSVTNLSVGDVIRLKVRSDNTIHDVIPIFLADGSKQKATLNPTIFKVESSETANEKAYKRSNGGFQGIRYIYGSVQKQEGSYLKLSTLTKFDKITNQNVTNTEYVSVAGAGVAKYVSATNTLKTGLTSANIMANDEIFIYQNNGKAIMIIIYE